MAADPDELPVWIDGVERWVSGITKRTTCDDVIYALMQHVGGAGQTQSAVAAVDAYAVFETWRGVERQLRGRTKLLKVWRGWGSDQKIKFVVKRCPDAGTDSSPETRPWRRRRRNSRKDRSSRATMETWICEPRRAEFYHPELNTRKRLEVDSPDEPLSSLVHRVLRQERQIQRQLARISELDRSIDTLEKKTELMTVIAREEFRGDPCITDNAERDQLETFLRISGSLFSVCERLDVANASVETLREELRRDFGTKRVRFQLDDAVVERHEARELEKAREELERCAALETAQLRQMALLTETLVNCDAQIRTRDQRMRKLLQHEAQLDGHSAGQRVVDQRSIHSGATSDAKTKTISVPEARNDEKGLFAYNIPTQTYSYSAVDALTSTDRDEAPSTALHPSENFANSANFSNLANFAMRRNETPFFWRKNSSANLRMHSESCDATEERTKAETCLRVVQNERKCQRRDPTSDSGCGENSTKLRLVSGLASVPTTCLPELPEEDGQHSAGTSERIDCGITETTDGVTQTQQPGNTNDTTRAKDNKDTGYETNSDTGLSSLHSSDEGSTGLETLV